MILWVFIPFIFILDKVFNIKIMEDTPHYLVVLSLLSWIYIANNLIKII